MDRRRQEAWKLRGACRGSNPNDWMDREEGEEQRDFEARVERARGVCDGCGVAGECLVWALRWKEKGIWAGTTRGQRTRMRRSGT